MLSSVEVAHNAAGREHFLPPATASGACRALRLGVNLKAPYTQQWNLIAISL